MQILAFPIHALGDDLSVHIGNFNILISFSILDMPLAKSLLAMVIHAIPHSTQTVLREIIDKVDEY